MNPKTQSKKPRLVRENYGGEIYEYYPLGEYVVVAPGVCGGRPTFKYTRLEVSVILSMIEQGTSAKEILRQYSESRINEAAISEAIRLASRAFMEATRPLTESTRVLEPA